MSRGAGRPVGGIRGCEGGPQSPSSLRAVCGAPRARETRASPRKWRGRAGSHALLQVFASYEEVKLALVPIGARVALKELYLVGCVATCALFVRYGVPM